MEHKIGVSGEEMKEEETVERCQARGEGAGCCVQRVRGWRNGGWWRRFMATMLENEAGIKGCFVWAPPTRVLAASFALPSPPQ